MAITVPIPVWKQAFRVALESAFNTNVATADWNIGGNGGGQYGWVDVPVSIGTVPFTSGVNAIFPNSQAGKRGLNQAAPVQGAYETTASLETPVYPELVDRFLQALLGTVARTPTAGTAALASTAFASVATLDTQPDGTEVLKFTIASSTAASSAVINIIQSAVTVETITIGSSATSVDGDYYSQGAYDGSSNAITFTVGGTVTAGTVVIAGVDKVSNVYTVNTTASAATTLKMEEMEQPKAAATSFFYGGCAVSQGTFSFDRTAADGLLMASWDVASRFGSAAANGTFANAANLYYKPLAGWTCSATKDGAAFDKIQSVNLVVNGNNNLFAVATGSQQPSGAFAGQFDVSGTIGILPEDAAEWNDFNNSTAADYTLIFTSPFNIVDTDKWTITVELTSTYIENYQETVNDQLFGADMGIRTLDHTSDSAVKITIVSRMPV